MSRITTNIKRMEMFILHISPYLLLCSYQLSITESRLFDIIFRKLHGIHFIDFYILRAAHQSFHPFGRIRNTATNAQAWDGPIRTSTSRAE